MRKLTKLLSGLLTVVMLISSIGVIPAKADTMNGWEVVDGNWYWYENGIKQGTEGRGKEIYDPDSDAWYWLDAVDGGKKATSKDLYQESDAGVWAEDQNTGTGKWVRYDDAGHMVKGWYTNENGTYYFDPIYGTMAKGYAVMDGQLYHFDKITGVGAFCNWDGINGWVVIDGNCYWYENGVRQGYNPDDPSYRGKEIYDPGTDAWYWLDNVDQGKKAVSKDVYQESLAGEWADREDGTGKWVRYNAQGHMIKGWSTNENGTYYFDPIYGTMAKGTAEIDGITYEFDRNTGILIGEASSPETTITRAEWVAKLVDTMDITLDETYFNKDENNNIIYSYADIRDNGYAKKIETALLYGVLPPVNTAEGAVNNFDPDGKVTREFAAYTAIHALGFMPDTNLACADAAELAYPMEAEMAVAVEMMRLKDNAFRPGAILTQREETEIRAFIEETLSSRQIDMNHQDELIFAEEVVEELAESTEYRVEEVNGSNVLVLPQNGNSSQLVPGDIVVLPAKEGYPQGVVLKVTGTTVENGEVKVNGEVPSDPLEVYNLIDMEGQASIDVDNIQVADGVTCTVIDGTDGEAHLAPVDGQYEMHKGMFDIDTEGNQQINKKIKFNLDNLMELLEIENPTVEVPGGEVEAYGNVSFIIEVPSIKYDINYTENELKELYIELPNSIELGVAAALEYSGEIEVGTVPIALPAGFSVDIGLYLTYGISGEITCEFRMDNIFGVQLVNGKLQPIKECSPELPLSASIDGKVGCKLDIALCFFTAPIYNIGTEIGAGVRALVKVHSIEALICTDLSIYMYLNLYVGEGSLLGTAFPVLSHTWEIFDADNSPFKKSWHSEKRALEDWKQVKECTQGSNIVPLTSCTVTLSQDTYIYDGTPKKPTVTVKNGNTIIPSSEYTVSYSDNINVGKGVLAKVTITAKSGSTMISGSVNEYFKIILNPTSTGDKIDLSKCAVTLSNYLYIYDGTKKEPTVTVKFDSATIPSGEYTVSYSNKKNVGTATVTITAKAGSTQIKGSVSKTFTIEKDKSDTDDTDDTDGIIDLSACTVKLSKNYYTYDGTEKKPTVTVKKGTTIIPSDEYTISYSNNVNTGTATVTITAKSGSTLIKGSTGTTFIIEPQTSTIFIDIGKTEISEGETTFIKAYADGIITYESSDTDIATITNEGVITGIKGGTVTITITISRDDVIPYIETFDITVANIKYQGQDGDIKWTISDTGALRITGKCSENGTILGSWQDYNNQITSAYIDVDGVKRLDYLFYCFNSLQSVDLSNLDTSSVTDMSYMFFACRSLTSVDVSGFDTSSVKSMYEMFCGCSSLTSVDVSGFDTSSVTDMCEMFYGCSSLTSVDVSGFDTSSVTDMRRMFSSCSSLTEILVGSKWQIKSNALTSGMFTNCGTDHVTLKA